jgi:hypothetical protein
VPLCIRVEHLFLGTKADNNADRAAKGRNRDQWGEKSSNTILTQDTIDWAHVYANQLGWTGMFIAECLGISKSTVYRVLNEEVWRYSR